MVSCHLVRSFEYETYCTVGLYPQKMSMPVFYKKKSLPWKGLKWPSISISNRKHFLAHSTSVLEHACIPLKDLRPLEPQRGGQKFNLKKICFASKMCLSKIEAFGWILYNNKNYYTVYRYWWNSQPSSNKYGYITIKCFLLNRLFVIYVII